MNNFEEMVTKRVRVRLLAGCEAENFNYTPDPVAFSYLFGILTEFTPFEITTGKLDKGQEVDIRIPGNEIQSYFGPLYREFLQVIKLDIFPPDLYLRITLEDYTAVSSKEVVQAMAGSLGHCGCGGGCGCG